MSPYLFILAAEIMAETFCKSKKIRGITIKDTEISEKCSFCQPETENLLQVFWKCENTRTFWYSVFSWLQDCQVIDVLLQEDTALGLRPDNLTENKLQINFCLLSTKYYIWLCRHRERKPKLDDFLRYFKRIYQIENNEYVNDSIENTQTIPKKWEPFLPYL